MGRQVVADPSLEVYLKSLCNMQEITVGLIIGQVSESLCLTLNLPHSLPLQPCPNGKDVVVHLAKTPHQAAKVETVAQIESVTVVEHALNVMKMLPGGFYVFGVFFVAPKDIFNEQAKVKSVILNLQQ